MTDNREELLAQRAEIDAKLAALDEGPDPLLIEAREIVAQWAESAGYSGEAASYRTGGFDNHGNGKVSVALAALRRGMELIPAPPPMGEDEIEALASKIAQDGSLWASQRDLVRLAIRETLRRVPAWPKTGEQPWIDWHGGECPVPAKTRVEVEAHKGYPLNGPAHVFDWESPTFIRRYRILSGEEA